MKHNAAKQPKIIAKKRQHVIDLNKFFSLLSAVDDEKNRETEQLIGQKPRPGATDEKPVRRAAHTLWGNLNRAFQNSPGMQDFARQVERDLDKYDGNKGATSVREQDLRLASWNSPTSTHVADWK